MPSTHSTRPPRAVLVPIFIVLNVAVFAAWHGWIRVPEDFMENNFLISWNLLVEGRWWTTLGALFSHVQLFHLVINMLVLKSFGSVMEIVLGRRFFFVFYIVAGVFSMFAHALISNYLLGEPDVPAVGASGALAALVLLFALMFPREKILVFGLIPLPAIWGAVAFIGLDVWGLTAQYRGGGLPIGHGAHLGGSFAGILTYVLIVRPRVKRRREAMLRAQRLEVAPGTISDEDL